MSCGRPHATDCREVLEQLYVYIDRELDVVSAERIRVHLDECGPCLQEHEVDQLVKALVCRCAREQAPGELREKILTKLRQRIDGVV